MKINNEVALPPHHSTRFGSTFLGYLLLCERKAGFYLTSLNEPSGPQLVEPGSGKTPPYLDRGSMLHLLLGQHYMNRMAREKHGHCEGHMDPIDRCIHAWKTGECGHSWQWGIDEEDMRLRLGAVYAFIKETDYPEHFKVRGVELPLFATIEGQVGGIPKRYAYSPTADLLLWDEQYREFVVVDFKVKTYAKAEDLRQYEGDAQFVGYSYAARQYLKGAAFRLQVVGYEVRSEIKGTKSTGPGTFACDMKALAVCRSDFDAPEGLVSAFESTYLQKVQALESKAAKGLDGFSGEDIMQTSPLMAGHICRSAYGMCPYIAKCWK